MAEHKFGGDWTDVKLAKLEKYLRAYRTIFSGNERARHFKTWYVDAFAGTGSRAIADAADDPAERLFAEDVYEDAEIKGYRDGSAPRWTPENRPYVDTSKPANEVAELRTRSVIPREV